MARRGKDLFELLAARKTHSGSRTPQSSQRSRPDVAAWARQAMQKVSDALPRRAAPKGKRKAARSPAKATRKSGGAPSGVSVPGFWASAMVLVALGVGFVVGRGTVDAAAKTEGLKANPTTQAPAGEDPQEAAAAALRPGLLPGGAGARWEPPDLTPEKEVESLSTIFYVVLTYPDSEQERASRMAYHLREHGLERARIKLFPNRNQEGYFSWAVLLYPPETGDDEQGVQARQALLEKLKNVPPPAFEPRFAARLDEPFKMYQFGGTGGG